MLKSDNAVLPCFFFALRISDADMKHDLKPSIIRQVFFCRLPDDWFVAWLPLLVWAVAF